MLWTSGTLAGQPTSGTPVCPFPDPQHCPCQSTEDLSNWTSLSLKPHVPRPPTAGHTNAGRVCWRPSQPCNRGSHREANKCGERNKGKCSAVHHDGDEEGGHIRGCQMASPTALLPWGQRVSQSSRQGAEGVARTGCKVEWRNSVAPTVGGLAARATQKNNQRAKLKLG